MGLDGTGNWDLIIKGRDAWVTHGLPTGHELASAGPFAKVTILAAIPRLWRRDWNNIFTLVADGVISV